MKECELCNSPARMFCESDQASLCWECDSKVHSANFLVARHPRNLLCHVCQIATPWQASGSKLGPTVSVCERCSKRCNERKEEPEESNGGNDDDDDDDDDDEEEDESDGDDDDDESGEIDNNDEDGDNQVVPWSSSSSTPPPVPSSSSSEDTSNRFRRNNGVVASQDNFSCSSSQQTATRPTNYRRSTLRIRSSQIEKKSAVTVKSIKQLEKKLISGNGDSSTILEMCKLSKDPRRMIIDAVCADSV